MVRIHQFLLPFDSHLDRGLVRLMGLLLGHERRSVEIPRGDFNRRVNRLRESCLSVVLIGKLVQDVLNACVERLQYFMTDSLPLRLLLFRHELVERELGHWVSDLLDRAVMRRPVRDLLSFTEPGEPP